MLNLKMKIIAEIQEKQRMRKMVQKKFLLFFPVQIHDTHRHVRAYKISMGTLSHYGGDGGNCRKSTHTRRMKMWLEKFLNLFYFVFFFALLCLIYVQNARATVTGSRERDHYVEESWINKNGLNTNLNTFQNFHKFL